MPAEIWSGSHFEQGVPKVIWMIPSDTVELTKGSDSSGLAKHWYYYCDCNWWPYPPPPFGMPFTHICVMQKAFLSNALWLVRYEHPTRSYKHHFHPSLRLGFGVVVHRASGLVSYVVLIMNTDNLNLLISVSLPIPLYILTECKRAFIW